MSYNFINISEIRYSNYPYDKTTRKNVKNIPKVQNSDLSILRLEIKRIEYFTGSKRLQIYTLYLNKSHEVEII